MATYYRDLVRTVERIQAEQQVSSADDEDADVWGLYEEGSDVAVQLFVIRDGNVVDRRELFWEKVDDYQPTYFLGEVLQRYYQDNLFIPPEVLIPFEVEECDLLTAWLTEQAGRKVECAFRSAGEASIGWNSSTATRVCRMSRASANRRRTGCRSLHRNLGRCWATTER